MEQTKEAPAFLVKLKTAYKKAYPYVDIAMPYLIIFAVSLLSSIILFYEGFPYGDDFYFHLPNIIDKYLSLKSDEPFSAISGNLALGYGYGQGLFYSPIPHLSVAFTAVIFEPFGITILGALKLILFIGAFFSGVFAFRLGLAATDGNRTAALLCACAYVAFPYRMFDALCRLAIAEALAFTFIPLFLLGLYRITNLKADTVTALPFVEIILGGSLLYLTHNLTALLVYIVGFIFLLLKIKSLIPLFKSLRFVICCGVSVLLLLGIASVGMFSQMELMSSGIYNLSNDVIMWTNREHLMSQTGVVFSVSGLMNKTYLTKYGFTEAELSAGILLFVATCIAAVGIHQALLRYKPLKKYAFLFSVAFAVPTVALVNNRIESYCAILVFLCLYLFCTRTKNVREQKLELESLPFSKTLWLCAIILLICHIFMVSPLFWEYLAPEFLLTIQFPWRSWSLIQLGMGLFLAIAIAHFGKLFIVRTGAVLLVALLIVYSQPQLQKRLEYESNGDWCYELDTYWVLNSISSLGHNKEYCPQILTDSSYVSEYSNSLHPQICADLTSSTFRGKESYYLRPAILSGDGGVAPLSAHAPVIEANVCTHSGCLVQLPLIYYPGYVIYASNLTTGAELEIEGENVDGLVSFSLPSGEYVIRSEYEGTALRRLSLVAFPVCLTATLIWLMADVILRRRKASQQNS